MQASKTTLKQLQSLIKQMPMSTIQKIVLPEVGMEWKKVVHTVAVTRQPLNSDSVARVICKIAAITIPRAKIEDILGRLKFIVVASQTRTWNVVRLLPVSDPTAEKPPLITALNLPHRMANAITHMTEVEALLIENMLHWSVRTMQKFGDSFLYGCIIPGEATALFSSLSDYSLVQGCVEGLGYGSYEDAKLHGENISNLLCKAYEEKPAEPPSLPVLSHSENNASSLLKPKPEPGMLSVIPEESLRDSDEMKESAASMLPGDTDASSLLKPKPEPGMLSVIPEESLRNSDEINESAASMSPGPYVGRRCEAGRLDRTLLETIIINLTIDSD